MSQFDAPMADCANGTVCKRYLDDILMTVNRSKLDDMVTTFNEMHEKLKFTSEIETDCGIPFLDLTVVRKGDLSFSVSWYQKITDTNVILNHYSLAPGQCKNALIRGTIHRLFQITPDWKNFDEDLGSAKKKVFEANQYLLSAYNPLIRESLNCILGGDDVEQRKKESFGHTNTLFTVHR